MADQTRSDITIEAEPPEVMAVIADFAAYPSWATGVQQAEVLALTADGRPEQVRFALDAAPIKDEYVLAYSWEGDTAVSWTLVRGKVLKGLTGAYELDRLIDTGGAGPATNVTYRLAVDIAIPMIGMLRCKAEKVIIDAALRGLKQRVEGTR